MVDLVQQLIGWIGSVLLVMTLASQVYRQWQQQSSKGVSALLFVGQTAASIAFVVYSWLVGDLVFIVTNTLVLLNAMLGLTILVWHRRQNPDE